MINNQGLVMNHRIILGLLLLGIGNSLYGFDLFDKDRGKPPVMIQPPPPIMPTVKEVPKPPPVMPPVPPPAPPPPQRDFVLQGTARIGNKWMAVLQAPDGKPIIQEWKNNEKTPLKEYPEYAVVKVEARKVVLAYPENSLCRASNVQKGIQCQENGKTAALKLQWRDAINPPPEPVQPQVQPPIPMPPQPIVEQQQLSPEEIQRREEERKKREELYKNFKRQVIKDEDVPPGMRVIRTPFGDRLVPDNRPQ